MSDRPERIAFYPGSFDPPTNGHLWVIEQIAHDYDQGVVAVGVNPEKVGRFPVAERLAMLREITSPFSRIRVTSFAGMYQADFAEMIGARHIVRGTRNAVDFGYESDIQYVNRTVNPDLTTVMINPPKELLQVSSSMVMGLTGLEGWKEQVEQMVPGPVFRRLLIFQQAKDRLSLEKRWQMLMQQLGVKVSFGDVFADLYNRYQEPHRHYHTLDHLKTCFNELDKAKDKLVDPLTVEVALWFHDAVYQAPLKLGQAVDDEGDSAQLAEDVLAKKLRLSKKVAQRAGQLILATQLGSEPLDPDAQTMVDTDRAILGRSKRLYDIYADQVRREYQEVSEERYKIGRKCILESFLSKPSIYQTDEFREQYEQHARANLERELQGLAPTKQN